MAKVPRPPYERNGKPLTFDIGDEKHRYFLSGGLPAPTRTPDGSVKCSRCRQAVPAVMLDTHVPGAHPVSIFARHNCAAAQGVA